LDSRLYKMVLDLSLEYDGKRGSAYLDRIASEYGYPSREALRSAFRRERKRRGDEKLTTEQRRKLDTPVVVFMDIETLPLKIEGLFWGIRDQYITPDKIKQDVSLLGWAAKYMNESEIISDIMTPKETATYDSKRVAQSAREFIASADYVVGHNWDGFDGGILNTEFAMHRIPPVAYRSVDTYSLLKKHFRLTSYKLAFVNSKFGIRDKISNEGFPLWERCVAGEQDALDEMRTYNEGDIFAVEDLFWYIQPYVNSSLPNFGVWNFENTKICNCGSTKFKMTDKYWTTKTAAYNVEVCSNCGALHRGRKNILDKTLKNRLLVSI